MKEILNWSRTIYRTDGYKEINHLYATLFRFLGQVPEEFKRCEDAEYLISVARRCHHLVNLLYRPTSPEGASKDDEFSRRSIEERWLTSYRDTVQALRHPGVLRAGRRLRRGHFRLRFPKGWRLKLGKHRLPRTATRQHPHRASGLPSYLPRFDGRIRNGNRLMSTELHSKYSCSIR